MHNWNFGIETVQLAQLTATPVVKWAYGYELPSDHLRKISVHDNAAGRGTVPHKVQGNQINSDAAQLYLVYVRRVTDPNLMIPLFRVALSKLIGSRLAVTLAQSVSRSKDLYKEFMEDDLPIAKSADALQDSSDALPESTWVTARFGRRGDNELRSSDD